MSTNSLAQRQTAAKVAGVSFLLSLVVPLLTWVLVLSRFIDEGHGAATAANILTEQWLFRLGVFGYVAMAVIAMVLGVALFVLLRPVNEMLAILALLLKGGEAVLAATMGVLLLVAVLILTGQPAIAPPTSAGIPALVGLFLEVHIPATAVGGILHGLNLIVFLTLLYRSDYVPRALAGFGVVAFVLIVLYDSLLILGPALAQMPAVQAIGWGPSIVFEISIGLWLLVKGVRIAGLDPVG